MALQAGGLNIKHLNNLETNSTKLINIPPDKVNLSRNTHTGLMYNSRYLSCTT